jgi:hypothetical protein
MTLAGAARDPVQRLFHHRRPARGGRCGAARFDVRCGHAVGTGRQRRGVLLDQRRQHHDESLDQVRIERASALVPEQPHCRIVADRLAQRPRGGHRIVVLDDREDAGADRDAVRGQPLRIPLAVPALVLRQDDRRHRIGERHGGNDFGADLRVDPEAIEFFRRQWSRLDQDVLGDRQFSDVVEQRGGFDALDLRGGQCHRLGQPAGQELDAATVNLGALILGIDRPRQRLDGRQMQVRRLLRVPLLHGQAADRGAVDQVDGGQPRHGDQREPIDDLASRGRWKARDQHGRATGEQQAGRQAPCESRVLHWL